MKKSAKDDILINLYESKQFFIKLGLNFTEESQQIFPLITQNYPEIIEETLRKSPRKKERFDKILIRSNSFDPYLSKIEILINPHLFIRHLSLLHTKVL